MNDHIFISHSSKDDDFVKELRQSLERSGLTTWVDSRSLVGGDELAPQVETAIEQARHTIAVLSTNTINSPWVRREIQKALEVKGKRKTGEDYRVIPLLLPGIEPSALPLWFDVEPVGVRIKIEAGGLSEALPAILAALGERLPTDHQPISEVASQPVEELILKLDDLKIETEDGKRRAKAIAQLIYETADEAARDVESKRFIFNAPLGVIEAEDLRWYLEEYFVWPIGVFKERAERIEARLPEWGQSLYQSAFAPQVAQAAVNAWQQAGAQGERRFSVFVDSELPDGATEEEQSIAREAATELLSLPWELLHDGRGFLFHGQHPVRVRRRLPNRHSQPVRLTGLPIRILLVSPRPEDDRVGYIDHRISARPLVDAVESLGELAKLSILTPPTFPALEEVLRKASDAGEPFDVVHFDGHGVYDHKVGLGGLCFEDPNETGKLEGRAMQLIHAEKLAEVIRDHRIPLIFLEACQTAKTEEDPTASVAAKLLDEGVTSVVAMSHSVLVETARRFVKAFYQELAQGRRVGTAMLTGQRELHRDTYKGKLMGAGDLYLQDWFVPVLYQEEQDPQLITKLPPRDVQQLQSQQRDLSLGELPPPPSHEFQGRSRELLALERLLHEAPYAVVRGQGGAGKTTLAIELARWLVRVSRFRRAAFVSLEQYADARSVLDSLGRQLLPEGDKYSVAHYKDLKAAVQPVERALADLPTIIVLDNMESVLPDHTGQLPPGAAPVEELFDMCQQLLRADPSTRILFTSRESLPAPFDHKRREIPLGALSREDAIKLVGEVMKQEGLTPKSDDPGSDPQEITDLVEAINRHARALVLLAREIARQGVRATTQQLHQLMEELDRKHPGERENSLYASVELSLRRLSPEVREQIKPLAVFHGGAHLQVFDYILGTAKDDIETAPRIFRELIGVGLGQNMGYGHLRLDPALPSYLLREMSKEMQEEVRRRWAAGMLGLMSFLYEQQFKDAKLSAQLTLLELPNLMAMLRWMQQHVAPEEVVLAAQSVEALLSMLGKTQAQAEATRVREQAARGLSQWSHARYLTGSASIDRLLESDALPSACVAAQQLLQRCLEAGEGAYPEAAYDTAMAHCKLGRVLMRGGSAEEALSLLADGQRRFQMLADAGYTGAEVMISTAITESGDCLRVLGRLDEAAEAYQESARRDEKLEDQRGVAVSKSNLGTIRLLQGQYAEALEIYAEARDIFANLGEPITVANFWHQIGMVHRKAGQYEQAERAYRQSLAIKVQQKDLGGEASSLGELGNLYNVTGRLEEAVRCYRQVADIHVKLQDQRYEGVDRSNLANALIKLQRYDEARQELLRAVECKKPYGNAAQSWMTWGLLYDLEQATGDVEAAAQARQQAIESYLSYRRAGGQSMTTEAQLCSMAAQAIEQSETTEMEQDLTHFTGEDIPPSAKLLISKLQAILRGDRNPSLADDPNLNYQDVVELQLLLESLGGQ